MYSFNNIKIENGSLYQLKCNDKILNYKEFLDLAVNNEDFLIFFIELLKEISFDAYFFECIPVNTWSTEENFEFVILNSETLSRKKANHKPFSKFVNNNSYAVSFHNLNRDALLIAPTLNEENDQFAHLAEFTKNASDEQQQFFWKFAFTNLTERINEKPLWFSTSGLGVYWLHLRIDTYPKYYQYKRYRKQYV